MTTNQTIDGVPRELLERLVRFAGGKAKQELCALLDPKSIMCHGCMAEGVTPDHFDSAGKCNATHPQGDTVAVVARWSDWSMLTLEIDGQHRTYVDTGKPENSHGEPVAPTPINYGALDTVERLAVCRGEVAPVAVALPERLAMTGRGLMDAQTVNHHLGWNACLDELKRLNPSL